MADLLAVVDMQRLVVDASSPWRFPQAEELLPGLMRLVAGHPGPVVATRHLLDADAPGSWRRWGERWHELCDWPALFALADGLADLPHRDKTVYSAFDVVRGDLPSDGALVVAGVETDCCIVATVFAAVDAGVPVVVLTDAVAGPDDLAHRGVLAGLARLPEQVRPCTVDEWLDGA